MLTSIVIRTLIAGTPLLLGTLGEICAERSGVLNLGVEGIMAVGAVSAFAASTAFGSPWAGLAAALLCGILCSLIHSFISISLKGNQVVSGLALTMLGLGVSGMAGRGYVGKPLEHRFSEIALPFLSDIPGIGSILFNRDPVFYISIILAVVFGVLLFYTRWGIVIRSVGENPAAAEAMGINVSTVRYLCVLAGGGLAGMAGAYLSLVYTPSWIEGMTAGRGWIVIALTIFAGGTPWYAFAGAFVFGGIDIVQYFFQDYVSPNLLKMLPYAATIAALAGASRFSFIKSAAPAALAVAYRRGER